MGKPVTVTTISLTLSEMSSSPGWKRKAVDASK